jgi:hypothetical protein
MKIWDFVHQFFPLLAATFLFMIMLMTGFWTTPRPFVDANGNSMHSRYSQDVKEVEQSPIRTRKQNRLQQRENDLH